MISMSGLGETGQKGVVDGAATYSADALEVVDMQPDPPEVAVPGST